MAYDKTSRVLNRMIKQESSSPTPIGSGIFIPNHSGDVKPPVRGGDLVNKTYADSMSGGAPEGTAVKSTGEGGGNKFLREDGDGTSSWQTPSGSGDVTAAVALTDGTIVQGDGGVKGVKTSTATVAQVTANASHRVGDGSDHADVTTNSAKVGITPTQASNITTNNAKVTNATHTGDVTGSTALAIASNVIVNADVNSSAAIAISKTALVAGTNITLSTNTLNVDDAFIKNDADDTSTHKITAANFAVTADNSSADTAYVPMVLYNTDATPPTASGFPVGTIYIQYTA